MTRDSDLPLLSQESSNISLFWPHVTDKMRQLVAQQLETRWLGQGPQVEEFERKFQETVIEPDVFPVAVNSGTSALHLSYLLAMDKYWPDWNNGDKGEAIVPVFTCTATNIPLRYLGLDIKWADIDPTSMNISIESIKQQLTPRTRLIVVVHYGGFPVDVEAIRQFADPLGIPVVEDAAQALGAKVRGRPIGTLGDYSAFSFQAIKHITTGDGGLLTVKSTQEAEKARRLRWFGIDRVGKQNGTWENDIFEVGYKYQMTDIAASLGLGGLLDLDNVLSLRRSLLDRYSKNLRNETRVRLLVPADESKTDFEHAAWLATVVVDQRRDVLRELLRTNGVEANPVHFRNDIYSTFQGFSSGFCPTMDSIDGKYLCLPLHTQMNVGQVDRICEVISSKW